MRSMVFLVALMSLIAPAYGRQAAAASLPHRASDPRVGGAATPRPADLRTVTLDSRALGGITHAYVLLPDSYRSTRRRYPVLYLLNGNLCTYGAWVNITDVVAFARRLPVIVVMPDGGTYWYTNPISGTGPRWEDYHIDELIPYIDTHFRTIATRAGRAVAGLSTGGYGAFVYAARHPDLFIAAASFSGELDLHPFEGPATFPPLRLAMGDPATDAWYWDGHDPVDLAANLRGVRLYLASGNGQPGPFERYSGSVDPSEVYSHNAMLTMAAALRREGIPARIEDYGAGTHTWAYWQRDLHHALRWLLRGPFAHRPARPARWSYRTTLPFFAVWGYQGVHTDDTHSWLDLQDVSPAGLTATGNGTVDITTAPLYRPGASYMLSADATEQSVRAGPAGRLSFTLVLDGPATPLRLAVAPVPVARRLPSHT